MMLTRRPVSLVGVYLLDLSTHLPRARGTAELRSARVPRYRLPAHHRPPPLGTYRGVHVFRV
eukprot:1940224-Prymnesium_polylepis.1